MSTATATATVPDLVLESRSSEEGEESVKFILPNIPLQLYTLGSKYPGVREGEEFLFCRYEKGVLNPTHCTLTIDKQGQYWIRDGTDRQYTTRRTRSSTYVYSKTFVNSERVEVRGPRLLKNGDTISLGDPAGKNRPIFHVTERVIPNSGLKREEENVAGWLKCTDSPFDNNFILSVIFGYLPLPDLKNARLVSGKWNQEASKAVEKKAAVSFSFGIDYINPQVSTRVFRYLHEMKQLKIRTIRLLLQPTVREGQGQGPVKRSKLPYAYPLTQDPIRFVQGEPGEKMLDDLRKLLNSSHNFLTLRLEGDVKNETDFLPFSIIMEKLGGKLEEVRLAGNLTFFPEGMIRPLLLPAMTNLKRFTHLQTGSGTGTGNEKWVEHLVPLFSNNLEQLTCNSDLIDLYLQEFLKHEIPKLKGVTISGGGTSAQSFSLLLKLRGQGKLLGIARNTSSGGKSDKGRRAQGPSSSAPFSQKKR